MNPIVPNAISPTIALSASWSFFLGDIRVDGDAVCYRRDGFEARNGTRNGTSAARFRYESIAEDTGAEDRTASNRNVNASRVLPSPAG